MTETAVLTTFDLGISDREYIYRIFREMEQQTALNDEKTRNYNTLMEYAREMSITIERQANTINLQQTEIRELKAENTRLKQEAHAAVLETLQKLTHIIGKQNERNDTF